MKSILFNGGAGIFGREQCDVVRPWTVKAPEFSGAAQDDDDPSQQISLSVAKVWQVETTVSISLSSTTNVFQRDCQTTLSPQKPRRRFGHRQLS